MKRPQETLGLPVPFGRRLVSMGKGTWMVGLGLVTLLCGGIYIYEVSQAASKSFALRSLEKQRDRLQESVSALEARAAEMQSMRAMQERIQGMGYVPVENPEFIEYTRPSYALAK